MASEAPSDATLVNRIELNQIEILPHRIESNQICFQPNRPALLLSNITFCDFCCFRCVTHYVAVNICINYIYICSFLISLYGKIIAPWHTIM